MSGYRSTVMRCYVGDNHCPVCRFIDGSRSVDDMLAVIVQLDTSLAEAEDERRETLQRLIEEHAP